MSIRIVKHFHGMLRKNPFRDSVKIEEISRETRLHLKDLKDQKDFHLIVSRHSCLPTQLLNL